MMRDLRQRTMTPDEAYARGVAQGLAMASLVARRSAAEVRTRPAPTDFSRRAQTLTAGALDALAASIDEAMQGKREGAGND